MEVKQFVGGIHVPHHKSFSEHKAIKEASVPAEIIIPLVQHTGVPNQPLVNVGDRVKAGQLIGATDKFVSAPVHASLSGTVTAVERRLCFTGEMVQSVVISVDRDQDKLELADVDLDKVTREEAIKAVREAGVVGMGGAAFPTAVKLSPPPDKKIDALLINGCECEPFLTCDHRIMVEQPEKLLRGVRLLMDILGVKHAYVCVEDNKPDAIEALRQKNKDPQIVLVKLPTKYPQGSEKHLVKAVLDREIPSGGLPFDVGTLIQNVGTCVAVYEAVKHRRPLIDRVVTVTGQNVRDPQNLLVKIGTPLSHLIAECGGIMQQPAKVVVGGPMTGKAQQTLEAPVVKGTTGVVVLPPDLALEDMDYRACVSCCRCVEHCPVMIYPNQISIYCEAGLVREAAYWNTMDCIECGICAYVCPSKRPIVQWVQLTKPLIRQLESERK
ncbi:MAG: electron transport complex subunit RsxC [Dehalococcoidia bacterium]|nr:electron transport complex subunit RsxC [Dehalococcoidia bacterium]